MIERFAVDTCAVVDLMRENRETPPQLLQPTQYTARTYAEVRVALKQTTLPAASKLNDLWIAALCLEHNLPLLTNDHGFDHIAGLSVVHW